MPAGVMEAPHLHTLDVSHNAIRTLPYGFYRSDLWHAGRVWLAGNPLLRDRDTRTRFSKTKADDAALDRPRAAR